MEKTSNTSCICSCCGCKEEKDPEPPETFMERRFSEDPKQETFCNSAFLPEYVREVIKEQGIIREDERKPMVKKLSGIILTCEIPAISEVIDFYSMSVDYSTEDIATTLNLHVSNFMQSIIAAGGDIIGLERGIIQCMWLAKVEDMALLSQKVLNAALCIQRHFGSTKTKFGRNLKNLIGISCGNFECFFIGTQMTYFVLVGNVVKDSLYASTLCGNNEVITSRELWSILTSTDEYQFQTLPDEFVTVFSVKKEFETPVDSSSEDEETKSITSSIRDSSYNQDLEGFEQRFGKEITRYLHPLHKSARTTQQIRFLCSLSQVACVVTQIKNLDLRSEEKLHETVNTVYDVAQTHGGVVKAVIYNQDITISTYFGYPGFKHGDDAIRSISFSQDVVKTLKNHEIETRVGISSGMVFCGVLGPPTRLDCCLLGMPVRTAFQFASADSEHEILCCLNTFFLTRRFVGGIFQTVKKKNKAHNVQFPSTYFEVETEPTKAAPPLKCVGRSREKVEITSVLSELKNKMGELDEEVFPFIMITGEPGMGKTTLLEWMMTNAEEIGFQLQALICNTSFEEPYENAWKIVQEILHKSGNDSEKGILNLVGDKRNKYPLHELNEHLDTEFQHAVTLYGEEDIRKLSLSLIKESSGGKSVLISIDNIEYVGTETWLFLQELLVTRLAVVVATATGRYNPAIPFVKYIVKQQYKLIPLSPLNEEELGLLACDVLNVKAINKKFLPFFQKHSEGNALRLEEILMIPTFQKHCKILPYSSIPSVKMETNFLSSELSDEDTSKAFVCDIIESEMWKIKIPSHLLDVVRGHTAGLSAEEQMLLRKCALLGSSFSICVLEVVCPEYPTKEIRHKIAILLQKHLLKLECHHLDIVEKRNRKVIAVKEIPMEFCMHPVQFYCNYLRNSVLKVMPESQRERLSLYLADLLMTTPKCDSCIQEWKSRRYSLYPVLTRNYHIPCVDMRMCQCFNLMTHFTLQVEYLLYKGNGSKSDRIETLLIVCEYGLLSKSPKLVDKVLFKAKRLIAEPRQYVPESETTPDPTHVGAVRLKAQVNLHYGKNNEAMRCIKEALLLLNLLFPADIENRVLDQEWEGVSLIKELTNCLNVGCFILNVLGMYEVAYKVGKIQIKLLSKHGYSFAEIVRAKSLLLTVVWKTKPSRKRDRQCRKLSTDVRQLCFKRLMDYPVLELTELKVVILAFRYVLLMLFEKGDLEGADKLGKKCFQLLILVKHEKELSRVLNILAHVYFYQQNFDKCFEMIGQLENAFPQCASDPIADAIYFSLLVLTLRNTNYRGIHQDKIDMCCDYASRCPPFPSHPKYRNRIYCLCAKMALWAGSQNLPESYGTWYNRAVNLQQSVHMNNYWTLSGCLSLIIADIEKIQRNFVIYTVKELAQIKQNLKKDLKILEKAVSNYAPVLDDAVQETEKIFQAVVDKCKILKL